jgi:hypothetical protein
MKITFYIELAEAEQITTTLKASLCSCVGACIPRIQPPYMILSC